MRLVKALIIAAVTSIPATAAAQYYEIANQLPALISPALSGSLNYKGFVEAGYTKGMGRYQADFLDISTVQGFRYSSWFFMGVGLGVDILFSHVNDGFGFDSPESGYGSYERDRYYGRSSTSTAVMTPVFTDFRFNLGKGDNRPSFFIDLRVGCSFLIGNDYVRINDGYLTNREYFYLRPTAGVRLPVNRKNTKQAVNVGLTYQLLTADYWYYGRNASTLNSLGASVSFEW